MPATFPPSPAPAMGDQGRDPDPSRPGPRPEGQQSCEGTGMWGQGCHLKGT